MKPKWSEAPTWANYLAQDESGHWFWFEEKPEINKSVWSSNSIGRFTKAWICEWKTTLEARPK